MGQNVQLLSENKLYRSRGGSRGKYLKAMSPPPKLQSYRVASDKGAKINAQKAPSVVKYREVGSLSPSD